jgi:hypothetical protein
MQLVFPLNTGPFEFRQSNAQQAECHLARAPDGQATGLVQHPAKRQRRPSATSFAAAISC